MTTDKISFEELQQLLADPRTPEAELANYFTLDPDSGPFNPRVVVDPEAVAIPSDPADGARSALIMNGAELARPQPATGKMPPAASGRELRRSGHRR